MRVWRNVDGTLVDAAIEPRDLVFLFAPDRPPFNYHGGPAPEDADYLVLDSTGFWFAQDGISGLRRMDGTRPEYNFNRRSV